MATRINGKDTVETLVAENAAQISALENSTMRYIKTQYLNADAATLTLSTDANGNAVNLTDTAITYYIPAVATTPLSMRIQINGITGNYYYDKAISASAASINALGGYGSTLFGVGDILLALIGGNIEINTRYSYSTSGLAIAGSANQALLKDGTITGITSIKLFMSSGNIPAGSYFKWEGRNV
jgi:hypothetical protein